MKVSDNGAEEKLIIADASDQKIASSRLLSFDLLLSYAVLSITINHLQWTPVMKIPNIIFRSLLSPAMSIFITISAYLFAEKYARMNGRNWFSKNNMRELLGKFFPSVIVFLLLKFIVIVGGGRTDIKNFLIDILGKGFVTGGGYPIVMLVQLIIIFPFLYRVAKFYPIFAVASVLLLNILYEMIPYSIVIPNSVYIAFFPRLSFSMLLGVLLYLHLDLFRRSVLPLLCIVIWFYFQFLTEVGYHFQILVRWKHNSSIFTGLFTFGVIYFILCLEKIFQDKIHVEKKIFISDFGQAFLHTYFAQLIFILLLYPSIQLFLTQVLTNKLSVAAIFICECIIALTFSATVGYVWFRIERTVLSKLIKRN